MSEKEFKLEFAKELRSLGCKVYLDEHLEDFPIFHTTASGGKPDLLFFHNTPELTPAILLELKTSEKLGNIINGMIEQLERKYKEKYSDSNQNLQDKIKLEDGTVLNTPVLLGFSTDLAYKKGIIYEKSGWADGLTATRIIERILWKNDMCLVFKNYYGKIVISYKNLHYYLNEKTYRQSESEYIAYSGDENGRTGK